MKVCFVGLGSIGKRHLQNFDHIMKSRHEETIIHALRTTKSELPESVKMLISKELYSYEEVDESYDMIFICNPTHLHYESLIQLSNKAKSFFIEKPIFETYLKDIDLLQLSSKKTYYVACPLRYNGAMIEIKKQIENINIYSVRALCSSYLPEWRANQDYRKTYSAHRNQGGGVRIDIIHEWDYLTDLFGFPQSVKSLSDRISDLEIDSDDIAVYIAKYADKTLELHLDYFGKKTQRYMELITDEGHWRLDLSESKVFHNNNLIYSAEEDTNEKYLREMRYFVELHEGNHKNVNDVSNAIAVMKLAEE